MRPSIGRIVIYRSRTGDYDCPAIITATQETINPEAAERGSMPALSSPEHVHLTVFTAGVQGLGGPRPASEEGFVSENQGGSYQEWNVPPQPGERADLEPASWRWPERVEG